MKLVKLDDPFKWIDKSEILSTTDDASEEKNLKHLTWYGVQYYDSIVLVLAYQEISNTLVSVSGWVTCDIGKSFLARSIYCNWLKFLALLRDKGYKRIYASTLKTNDLGIRFNEHAGYEIHHEDDTTIYWLKEL